MNLAAFQQDFGRYLRHPQGQGRPAGVPARRGKAYRELLFNNVCGVIDACFPVSRRLLGGARWLRLQRLFFAEWRSQTPLFCELAREFLRWLEQREGLRLPAYLPSLLHYEWAELAVDILPTAPVSGDIRPVANVAEWLQGRPQVMPAHMLLAYDWPVHRIGADYRPRKPQPVQLVVFRNADEAVQFAEINAVTARLIALLAPGTLTGEAACLQVAAELQHPNPQAVVQAGAGMIDQLKTWGVVHGIL